jgi:predicted secreted protein
MSLGSGIAIYFIIWWTVLFAVLPFGVRNSHEAGENVGEGHDSGAPVRHGLKWKALVTTGVAAVLFSGVYWAVSHGFLSGQQP